jgi:hypothetical protein
MIISTTPFHLPQAVNLGHWPSMIEEEPCQISTWMTGTMHGNGFMGGLLQGNLFGGWCAINRDAVDHWSSDQHRHSGRDGVRPGEQYSVLQYITLSAGP